MHLVIYGPEGSGKGTQASLLSGATGLPVITSGDLVRKAASNPRHPYQASCQNALMEGKYVPDSIVFDLWKSTLEDPAQRAGFILDGFPRNRSQAEFLFSAVEKLGYSIDRLIHLTLSDEEAVRRLVKRHRAMFEGSSDNHDTPDRIHARLSVYRELERDLIDYVSSKGILLTIDGNGTQEDVHRRICMGLGLTS